MSAWVRQAGQFWWDWVVPSSATATLVILGAWLLERGPLLRLPAARSWLWRIVYVKLSLLIVLPWPILFGIEVPGLEGIQLGSLAKAHSTPGSWLPTTEAGPEGLAGFDEDRGLPSAPRVEATRGSANAHQGLQLADWTGSLGALWLLGVLFSLSRLLSAHRAAQRLLREAEPLPSERLCLPGVFFGRHPSVRGPMVVGLRHPAILIPDLPIGNLADADLEAILSHEGAHLRRRDLAWAWLRGSVRAILFFHPLVWWADSRAAIADEIACDDAAVAATGTPAASYGRTLLEVARRGAVSGGLHAPEAGMGIGMGRPGKKLAERLTALGRPRRRLGRAEAVAWVVFGTALLGSSVFCFRASRDIRQFDPRHRVLGFTVSHGRSHTISLSHQEFRWRRLRFGQTSQVPGPNGGPTNLPRWPGWLCQAGRSVGLDSVLDSGYSTLTTSTGDEGCAIFVRFAAEPGDSDPESLLAELVDDQGEGIPLPPGETVQADSSGFLRLYTLSPAPITPGRFELRILHAGDHRNVARIQLGHLNRPELTVSHRIAHGATRSKDQSLLPAQSTHLRLRP